MQPRFCTQVLKACQGKGIHTALDTSGFAEWQTIQAVVAYVDLILYDLKIIDSTKHKTLTGVPNELILDNLLKLAHSNVGFILRLPIIPHVNDSYKDLKEMTAFIDKLKKIRASIAVDLLPYHQFAEPKYEKFGKKYALKGLVPQSGKQIKRIVRLFEENGISVNVV